MNLISEIGENGECTGHTAEVGTDDWSGFEVKRELNSDQNIEVICGEN